MSSGFESKVMSFITKLRCENSFDESFYDSICDEALVQAGQWKATGAVPLESFVACIELVNALAGGNRFLPDEEAEKLEDASDEIYAMLTFCD